MTKKSKLSLQKTYVSLRRSSVSNWSSACSIEDPVSTATVTPVPTRTSKKVQKSKVGRPQKTMLAGVTKVEFASHGSVKKASFPCFLEDQIIDFGEHSKPKLKRLSQDFDVESNDELIRDAVRLQANKILKAFQDPAEIRAR